MKKSGSEMANFLKFLNFAKNNDFSKKNLGLEFFIQRAVLLNSAPLHPRQEIGFKRVCPDYNSERPC